MRLLVVGGHGMLGTDLVRLLQERGHEVTAPSIEELDITEPMSIARIIDKSLGEFDWCINCAAYTAVDKAETEVREATEINTIGASYLALSCAEVGIPLIHVSTDFVFDGKATEPYTEDAKPNPLGVYGRTKYEGESAVRANHGNARIVRTAWLYGIHGASFPRTMIKADAVGKSLRVVADQTGSPTSTVDLAKVLVAIAEQNVPPGIYHAAGPESMTWHEFATRAINAYRRLKGNQDPVQIEPIKTEDWPTPAPRPKYSVLATPKLDALNLTPMRPVDESLREFVATLQDL